MENKIFRCDICNYSTKHRGDLKKHFQTLRHRKSIETYVEPEKKQVSTFKCNCGRYFSYIRNLSRHQKSCKAYMEDDVESLTDAVKTLVAENKKLSECLKGLVPNNSNELVTGRSHTTNNNITNHNYGDYQPQYITAIKDSHINMQVFLDKHCGDAINLTSFIETLKLNSEDLDETRERGLAYSLGKVLIRGLKELEMNKRPIHCSDLRKSIMYVRDNNAWELDKKETQLRNAINILSSKQVSQIKDWEQSHPEWDKTDAGKQLYAETVHKILQVARDTDKQRIENQVIKTIAKETLVDDTI